MGEVGKILKSKSSNGVPLFTLSVVLALFLCPANLLYILGINYEGIEGGITEKIHPYVYLALIGTLVNLSIRRKSDALHRCSIQLTVVTLVVLLLRAVLGLPSGGGENAILIVTYGGAGLTGYLLSYCGRQIDKLWAFLRLFAVVNSILIIYEGISGARVYPYVINNYIIDFDPRPTALLGHPLANALLTGLILLIELFISDGKRRLLSKASLITLYGIALILTGGRAAIVATVVCVLAYILDYIYHSFLTGRGGTALLAFLTATAMITVAMPVFLGSGAADNTIARFYDDKGSDETRTAAIQIINSVQGSELYTGVNVSDRRIMLEKFGTTRGIELSPIALTVVFGLPSAILLMIFSLRMLGAAIGVIDLRSIILLGYLVFVMATSLSIGGKTLLLAQSVACLWCYGRKKSSIARVTVG